MNTQQLPSSWQLGDKVQVVFSGNGILQGKIIKVAFTEYGESRYDVEVPFDHTADDGSPAKGYFRIHGVDQYFLSYTQEDWDAMKAERKGPWVNAFKQPPPYELMVAARIPFGDEYDYTQMWREKEGVFIGKRDGDLMYRTNSPELANYEWLDESDFPKEREDESLLPVLGKMMAPGKKLPNKVEE